MSGGSGLRRFVASADTRTSTGKGEATPASTGPGTPASTGPDTGTPASTGPDTGTGTGTPASVGGGVAQAHAAATDARATLEAVLGRPLEPTDQPAGGYGVSLNPGIGTDSGADTDQIEKCELCSTVIPAEHGHLADLESSSLMCACRACYLLFTRSEAVRGRYRAVPDRYLTDPEHPISTADWEALEIPVGLAFFLNDSRTGHVTGFYPSPAGATECRLDLQAWNELTATHPLLTAAEPDVEAILISRQDPRAESRTVDSFIVPIDACYELAGRMRLYWRGFDGGSEAKSSITEFLGKVRTRSRLLDQGAKSQGV